MMILVPLYQILVLDIGFLIVQMNLNLVLGWYLKFEDAIKFYKHYAYITGFSVRLSTTSTRSDGVLTHKYLVCSKEGFKEKATLVDTVNSVEQIERHKRDSRCGCFARMCLNIIDGGTYRVYSFEEAHNHWLVDDIGKQYLNQNRQLYVVHQNSIMQCGKYRIGATKAHHLVKDLCGGGGGGFSNIGATITDFKNFKRDLKLYIGLNDAQMIVDSLSNKKNTCQGYSFEYYADEHDSLSRLFWADQIERGDCIIFGDVVSFDATYKTNKSVTLAAGLISKEDVDSYTWLLTCYKNFVVRDPSVIVTDQDAAMKVAISRVFLTSRHRFCMWHITEKLQSKANFIESDDKLKCSCNHLESCGYICRHLFCVMFFMRFERIPEYMVIPRWHKEASRKHNPGLYVEDADFSKKNRVTNNVIVSYMVPC
ncbi:hypothetical protein QQ045_009898 [Rhodiola kirilowii]